LATSRAGPPLRVLDVHSNEFGAAGARALARAERLAELPELNLGWCAIGDAGARHLASSRHLGRLTDLDLSYNELTLEGLCALVRPPRLARLARLDLSFNRLLDAAALRALGGLRQAARLTALRFHDNPLGLAGAEALAASPHLANLRELKLVSCGIDDA